MSKINLVALIDDDEIVTYVEKMVIEKTHLVNQIKVFSNGQDAIDFLKSNSEIAEKLPEIILLDLSMPVMNGFQFLEKFVAFKHKLDKKITIYVVSSSNAPYDLEKIAKISEVSGFVIKPITEEKFKQIAQSLKEEVDL